MSSWLSSLTITKNRTGECRTGDEGKKELRFVLPRQESVTSVTSGSNRMSSPPPSPKRTTASTISTFHLKDDGSSQPVARRRLSNDTRPVAPSRSLSFRTLLTRRFSNETQPQATAPVRLAATRRFSNESKLESVKKTGISRRFSNESAPAETRRHASLIHHVAHHPPSNEDRVEGLGARIRRRLSNDKKPETKRATDQVSSIHHPLPISPKGSAPKRSAPKRSKSDNPAPHQRPTDIHFLGEPRGATSLSSRFREGSKGDPAGSSACEHSRAHRTQIHRRHSICYQQDCHSDPSVTRVGFKSDQDILDAYEKIVNDYVDDRMLKPVVVPKPSNPPEPTPQEKANTTHQDGPPVSPTSVAEHDYVRAPPSLLEKENSLFDPTGWE